MRTILASVEQQVNGRARIAPTARDADARARCPAEVEADTLWTAAGSVSWDVQSGKQVFMKLEPHVVVGLDAVRHAVQRAGRDVAERVEQVGAGLMGRVRHGVMRQR